MWKFGVIKEKTESSKRKIEKTQQRSDACMRIYKINLITGKIVRKISEMFSKVFHMFLNKSEMVR